MSNKVNDSEKKRKKSVRDYTWQDYGISKRRYKELKKLCQSGEYDALVRFAAHTAAPDIEMYIYLSVTQNRSYRRLEAKWELGEIERMPYSHNEFYGYRRKFYYKLNHLLMAERENESSEGKE